jgi:hypothetical protein
MWFEEKDSTEAYAAMVGNTRSVRTAEDLRIVLLILVLAAGFSFAPAASGQAAAGANASGAVSTPYAAGIVPQASASVVATAEIADDITPFTGPVGPVHPLYGLKLSLENMDESFTPSPALRIDKQLDHAGLRISEAKAELARNRVSGAETAIGYYREKVNTTIAAVGTVRESGNDLVQAQEMVAKHEYILEQLLTTHQDTAGLQTAYAESRDLAATFTEKTEQMVERQVLPDKRVVVQVVRITGQTTPVQPSGTVVSPVPFASPVPSTTTPAANLTPWLTPEKTQPPQNTPDTNRLVTPVPSPAPVQQPQGTPSKTPAVTPLPAPQITPRATPQISPQPTQNTEPAAKPQPGTGNTTKTADTGTASR